jgi:hypothetical protein
LAQSVISHASSELSIGRELSRLLSAAVVNREFCNLLLANPARAVATGYNGEPFDLAVEEEQLIFSIRATTLADFAKQLTQNGHGNANGNGYHNNHNGNGYGHNGHSNGSVKGKVCGHE